MQAIHRSDPNSVSTLNPSKTLHSIRLVEIPWTNDIRSSIRLSIDDGDHDGSLPASPTSSWPGVRISE